jgi:methoxymalonate biosynthesis protein
VIKCVVWDLDNTLLAGVYLESAGPPPSADPQMASLLAELAARGILHAVASRNPPEAAAHAQAETGKAFAAIRCGWGPKSEAVAAILDELGLAADSVAVVDDDALERAEVAFAHPDVLVLAPQQLADAVTWPQFNPPVVTDEARRRGELYLQRRARSEEASAFGGSRDDFLRYCGTTVAIAAASPADLPRLHELSVRTHQFNSSGVEVSEGEFGRLLGSPEHRVITVWLSDRYGDDGLVGACVLRPSGGTWDTELLMMSCRAMGRGVIDALLAWICRAARAGGAAEVTLPCVISPPSVPLRIALTAAGFRAAGPAGARTRIAVYARRLDEPLPAVPTWAHAAPDLA